MKEPIGNRSAAAKKLRAAALAFAEHAGGEPLDDHDRRGQARNAALLRAAIEYARVGTPQLTPNQRELMHQLARWPAKFGLTYEHIYTVLSREEFVVLRDKGYTVQRGRGPSVRVYLTEAGERALWARTG